MSEQWHKPLRRLRSYLNWHLLDDRRYVERRFRLAFGRPLDLSNPQTLNAKIQWIKLFYRRSDMANVSDKLAARTYIAERIGGGHLPELFGVYDSVAGLRAALPALPPRFVLKATHGCRWNIFVQDKAELSADDFERLRIWLELNYYRLTREWAYDQVPPRLIAEAFHQPAGGGEHLIEYCIYCFHGEPLIFRFQLFDGPVKTRKTYDRDWKEIPVGAARPIHPFDLPKPRHYEQIIEFSRALSAGWPLLRVDFYETDELHVGELTCYPNGGYGVNKPEHYDLEFGRWLGLSNLPVTNPYTPRGLSLGAVPF